MASSSAVDGGLNFVESVTAAATVASVTGVDAPTAASGVMGVVKALLGRLKAGLSNREALQLQFVKVRVLSRSFFNPREFSKPPDRATCINRMQTNAAHYKAIYGLVLLTCLVYTILSSPMLLFGLALLLGVWSYAFVLNAADTPITLFGYEMKRRPDPASPRTCLRILCSTPPP